MANKNYERYLDMLMKNYPLESDSDDEMIQSGGGPKQDGSVPYGGFPPILLCNRTNTSQESSDKNREYSTHKTAVSIKDIMQKRRNTTPFIPT